MKRVDKIRQIFGVGIFSIFRGITYRLQLFAKFGLSEASNCLQL
jgi:hypothetical protein